jgi:hypothetical protein
MASVPITSQETNYYLASSLYNNKIPKYPFKWSHNDRMSEHRAMYDDGFANAENERSTYSGQLSGDLGHK